MIYRFVIHSEADTEATSMIMFDEPKKVPFVLASKIYERT